MPTDFRDLSDGDVWQASLARSKARRRRAEQARASRAPARRVGAVAITAAAVVPVATGIAGASGKGGSSTESVEASAYRPTLEAVQRAAGIKSAKAPVAASASKNSRSVALSGTSTPVSNPVPTATVAGVQQAIGLSPDGVFGSQTKAAVKRYQQAHGLHADGVVGAATARALGLGAPASTLRAPVVRRSHAPSRRRVVAVAATASHSSSGSSSVADVQRALGISADGVFGSGTADAVKNFQSSHGLTADGVVGPGTADALGIAPPSHALHERHSSTSGSSGDGTGGVIARMMAAANEIAGKPYQYGGGHGSFNSAGYDCSGSVSFVLHAGGLLSTPLDSSGLASYGSPGPGKHITIYANPGHAWMTIDGRRFDTGGGDGSRWKSDSRSSSGFVVRHPTGY